MTLHIAMKEVLSNPLEGATDLSKIKKPIEMVDIRWSKNDGWVKMAREVNGIEIHFVYNYKTGMFDDFKFEDWR